MGATQQQKAVLEQLKKSVGRAPFDVRLDFSSDNFAKCPFHNGDGDKSLHLENKSEVWVATCFSDCAKSWDAPGFVMAFDRVNFPEALNRLHGGTEPSAALPEKPTAAKPKAKRMPIDEWRKWGREITAADVATLAAIRKDYTAKVETWKLLDCRVKDNWIGFPYTSTVDGETAIDLVKKRSLAGKDFETENQVASNGVFNLRGVEPWNDVFVVEGEPDVAVMVEHGFAAVSPIAGSQKKLSKQVIETLSLASRIFVIGDQAIDDEQIGQICMDVFQKALPLEKTYRIRFEDAKDVCELRRKCGSAGIFKARIEEMRDESLTPWVSQNIPLISSLSPEPQKWVVDRMFPYGCLSLICGKQGAMKSFIGLFAADALTSQNETKSFLGRRIPEGLPVLYLDRENTEAIAGHRMSKLLIGREQELRYWHEQIKGAPVPEPDDSRLYEWAERTRGFLIFDSLQDWYGELNENDNSDMVRLMRSFQKLARVGAGVLVLHHAPKYGEAGYRGATSIVAIPEMSFVCSKTDAGIIELREARFRACASYEIDLKVHFGNSEWTPDCSFPDNYTIELIRDESASQVIQHKQEKRERKDHTAKLLCDYIEQHPQCTTGDLALYLGRANDNTGRHYAARLAKRLGWIRDKETSTWSGSEDVLTS